MKLISRKSALLAAALLAHSLAWSQNTATKLATAFQKFEADPQLQNGIASLYVIDAKTGQVVLDRNSKIGLAPASTMKIITSISAYELLGKDFRYKTKFALHKGDHASLLVMPSGDPTFGSWRWPLTKEGNVLKGIAQALQRTGIKAVREVVISNEGWNEETVPDGWMWQDIANYYGAGAAKLNWRENQYDVILKSGKQVGDPVSVVRTVPSLNGYALRSELTSAAVGTGDNAYIYFPMGTNTAAIRGTIPVNENSFKISGALPSGAHQFVSMLADTLKTVGISLPHQPVLQHNSVSPLGYTEFHTVESPPLDSIVYWFNRKSVNLYGEALVKTIAYKNTHTSDTPKGLEIIRQHWSAQGIAGTELAMVDGSGLSPLNRVTTHAQVRLLQYARQQNWYRGFYASLPVYNGMKMKSGTIRGVKGYTGYHKARDGREYIFAFVVNNCNGSAATLVKKMYGVLDELK
ncbi:D-alanyl-D-alanine carboxypeptidase/D-alanyl-D-alanine-endopeptidase [Pontibacter sp. JH31]|uniref:D-alanyl-D-alanine carboxypeptidase/D-alanyl-D-alanine-endopeptidase n=1 Tax=Pontibacter aquaedesilientis TaxID=2766980 RepID=A0ABR7XCW2_9BACT|nr:D-alanyl-D-alanine carboxypeptidase/D-alanyl-D-alanine-endopeptidase [Pontibacter aquaedesilientis]MBD1395731.1 D-alanyl-D-alanine carboxypeptidase/D-alanyl-D-alanine-endopeptidase [Pontibacter aquaedesilientis]